MLQQKGMHLFKNSCSYLESEDCVQNCKGEFVAREGESKGSGARVQNRSLPYGHALLKVMVMAHTPIVNRQTRLSFSARHAGMQAAGVWGCSCNKLVSGGAAGRLLVSGGGTGWQKSPLQTVPGSIQAD